MALAAPSSYVQAAGLPLGGGLPRGQGTPRQGHLRTSRGLGDVEVVPGSSNSNTQLPHLAGGSYVYHVWLRGRAPPTVSSRPPPSSRLGQAPGRAVQCTRIPVWWVVAHVPRPHCPAARTGCVLWRRKFPAAKDRRLYDPPPPFHEDDAIKSASAQGMLRATRRLRRPPGPPASRACGSIDRKRHRTLRRLAASLEIISANPRRAPAVSAFNAPHSHW